MQRWDWTRIESGGWNKNGEGWDLGWDESENGELGVVTGSWQIRPPQA